MPLALVAVAGWSLFAFAGAYRWTVAPLVVGALVTALIHRPRLLIPPYRRLDGWLLAAIVGGLLQLVPCPRLLRDVLSPTAATVHSQLELDAAPATAFRALSLDPLATAWSLATAAACLIVFWTARRLFERSSPRRVVSGIAWCGLTLAVIVFIQRAISPHQIYGFWTPIVRTPHPTPLGPFVNRNDLAAWLLMAIPLVLGYAAARVVSRGEGRRVSAQLASLVDTRMVALTGALVLMSAALVATLSRSGLIGLGLGLLTMGVVGRRRLGVGGSGVFVAAIAVLFVLALPYANASALAGRLTDTLPADVGGRLSIWRETWAMAQDFLAVGIGVGAFERGMLVYQQGSRLMFINHAHNEYLQVLTEGGLLIAFAVLAAIIVGASLVVQHLRTDSARTFWIRAGALGALVGVGAQSMWDTALRMPANGVLFAIIAAVALHAPTVRTSDRSKSPDGRRPDTSVRVEN